jgi:hypothetical protein
MKSEGLVKCVCVCVNTGGLNMSLCNKCSMHLVGVRDVRFLGRLEVQEGAESLDVGGRLSHVSSTVSIHWSFESIVEAVSNGG